MKIITITGKGDKRLLIYPLMHIVKHLGKVCLIADEPGYKRLYPGYANEGGIDEVDIRISNMASEDEHSDIDSIIEDIKKEEYDYIIISTTAYIPLSSNKSIVLNTQTSTFLGWQIEEYVDKNPNVTITSVTMYNRSQKKKKKLDYFKWNSLHFQYFCGVEEDKHLYGIKDKNINDFLKRELLSILDIPSATFDKLSLTQGGKK